MIWKNILGKVKPEFGHLSKHLALIGNFIIEDYIKTTDTVCGNHDQAVSIVVDLTYFTFFDWLHFLHFFTPRQLPYLIHSTG